MTARAEQEFNGGAHLVGGGTWLGVQPQREALVVVTNVRSTMPPDPAKASRGALVRDLLTGAEAFAQPDPVSLDAFNAFNLLAVFASTARLLTNRPAPPIRALAPGIHALANEAVDAPCPRAGRLAAVVKNWLSNPAGAPAALLGALNNESDPALFLRNPVYGTRCSTMVAIAPGGRGRIVERRYDKGGNPAGETALDFKFG